MKSGRAKAILGRLHKVLLPDAGFTDGQLLGQYVVRRDDAAFAALVRRHGPMVMGVCRRILRHAQDAEDAFQATFVVLARKAARVANREALASWLYGVAYRAALQARASSLRRKAKEQQVEDMPQPLVMPETNQREMLELLDRELARLPEKYRLPVVLCELEGRSRREAARQLGLPEGTLSSRLATARKRLGGRMSRPGTPVTEPALTGLFAGAAQAGRVPGSLVISTVRAAGTAVPAGVAALAEGVLKAMFISKLKVAAWALMIVTAVGVGATVLTYRTTAAEPVDRTQAAARASKDDLEALRLEVEALRLSLQATRARVQVLEDEAQEQKGRIGTAATEPGAASMGMPGGRMGPSNMPPGGPPATPNRGPGMFPPGGMGPGPGGAPQGGPLLPGQSGGAPTGTGFFPSGGLPPGASLGGLLGSESGPQDPKAIPPKGAANPAAEAETAAKKLRQDPTNKQALEELERAVERLKQGPERKPLGQ